jgi:hypothetical protein
MRRPSSETSKAMAWGVNLWEQIHIPSGVLGRIQVKEDRGRE